MDLVFQMPQLQRVAFSCGSIQRVPDNHYCIEIARPPLESSLPRMVRELGLKRSSAGQWLGTLRSLVAKGIKPEELEESGVLVHLQRFGADEVGEKYRVVYEKPSEDPNHRIAERAEIQSDGMLAQLPSFPGSDAESVLFSLHIVSGGQTGVDRGALDFAIEQGYTHGGWAPQGREAEDGKILMKYQLLELNIGGYRQRTRRNVEDSDGTLIINRGELDGGTLATQVFAKRLHKPYLVVQLELADMRNLAKDVVEWILQHQIRTLNVAGPRESKRPGIYRLTRELLDEVVASQT